MLPDTWERYLSYPLFADTEEEMTEEEIALSPSTPDYHMPTGLSVKILDQIIRIHSFPRFNAIRGEVL